MAGFFDRLLSGGKYARELKELQKKAASEPKNFHLQVRIGDLLQKMGKKDEALEVYRKASEQYAQNGFLIQAIAVNKVILRLDPRQTKIHEQLAGLYAQRGLIAEEEKGAGAVPSPGEALPAIPLFSDLKKEELSRIMEKIDARKFPPGAAICREGDAGDSIFIISHGRVGILRQEEEGGKVRVCELGEGDFFGEFGFFSGAARTATVEALVDTVVLEFTKQHMREILGEFPAVSEALAKFYKERVLDNLLATSQLFRSFSAGERKQILGRFRLEEFPAGSVVLEEGAQGDYLYIIRRGEAEVFTVDIQGRPVPLARLKEGDFFGEISLLTGRPRTASVKLLQPAELMRLDKKDFDEISARHPELTQALEEALHLRLGNKLKALGVFQDSSAKKEMV